MNQGDAMERDNRTQHATLAELAEHAIATAVAAEREACAQVCDEHAEGEWDDGSQGWRAVKYAAAAIRARATAKGPAR